MSSFKDELLENNKQGIAKGLKELGLIDLIESKGHSFDLVLDILSIEGSRSVMDNCTDRNGYLPYFDLKGDIEKRDLCIKNSNKTVDELSRENKLSPRSIRRIRVS